MGRFKDPTMSKSQFGLSVECISMGRFKDPTMSKSQFGLSVECISDSMFLAQT